MIKRINDASMTSISLCSSAEELDDTLSIPEEPQPRYIYFFGKCGCNKDLKGTTLPARASDGECTMQVLEESKNRDGWEIGT